MVISWIGRVVLLVVVFLLYFWLSECRWGIWVWKACVGAKDPESLSISGEKNGLAGAFHEGSRSCIACSSICLFWATTRVYNVGMEVPRDLLVLTGISNLATLQ
jgi:hypothetical protein